VPGLAELRAEADELLGKIRALEAARKRAGAPPRMSAEERAIGVLLAHPGWTNREIAARAGCHPKHLSRLRTFRRYQAALRALAKDGRPRGFLRDGQVEGIDEG
jgi:hypothetical protein